ncbi:hypothetical protein FHY03_000552 [Sphingomonas sp. BK345]|nr:hypothetical protein [Sphingomonas sp. BK345]
MVARRGVEGGSLTDPSWAPRTEDLSKSGCLTPPFVIPAQAGIQTR